MPQPWQTFRRVRFLLDHLPRRAVDFFGDRLRTERLEAVVAARQISIWMPISAVRLGGIR
jgi:hypothetical protein